MVQRFRELNQNSRRTDASLYRSRSVLTRSAKSVRNTARGEDSSSATDGAERYQVEDPQVRHGSRASSVESKETGDTSDVYDSTDNSLAEPFQNLRLRGAGAVADISRPGNRSPAGVGQGASDQSGAFGATIKAAAVVAPSAPPLRPRKHGTVPKAKKSRGSFKPREVSSTPGSSENGDSDGDAELFAADMSAAMKVKYEAFMEVKYTSIGLLAVSPSSARVVDEASDAAAAAILASQMGHNFGASYLALFRTVQRARRRGYMAIAAVYESLLSRMEVMAGVSSSIASVSAGTALLPTTARPAKFVPMQEAVIRLCSSLLECFVCCRRCGL